MENAKVALGLAKLTVANLLLFVRTIIDAMTGNVNFTTPAPPLADLGTAADELEIAEEQKKSLGLANRDEKRLALSKLVVKEGRYVEDIADGVGSIIESAAMPLRKVPAPVGPPGAVRNLKIRDGVDQGEVEVSHRAALPANDNQYFTQYSLDPSLAEKSWVSVVSTGKLRVLITGLLSGRRVAFRVRAKNTAGFGPWSTVAFRTIQ